MMLLVLLDSGTSETTTAHLLYTMSFFNPRATAPSQASKAKSKDNQKLQPWVEKYRPKNMNEISHQDEVVDALKSSIKTNQLPHLLLYGPAGTGKTSTALALCKELFGSLYGKRVLELNASDERGISVVREKIKQFAQTAVPSAVLNGRQVPQFKIIILDEADSMTKDAQSALRRTMEKYTRVTRFIMICNYVSRIIEPLASRCAKFRFKSLSDEAVTKRLKQISSIENIKVDDAGYTELLASSGGDLRKAVTLLQASSKYNNNVVVPEVIREMCGTVPERIMISLWTAIKSNKYNALQSNIADIVAEGYSTSFIFSQLHDDMIEMSDISDVQKAKIAIFMAEADKAIDDGASEELQLYSVASFFMQQCSRKK